MNRRKIQLQLRLILVMYRMEKGRRNAAAMREFRQRARSILLSLETAVRPHPDLKQALAKARREIETEI